MVEYAGNAATLFISDVASLGNGTGTNYKCFSSEAQTDRRIVITSGACVIVFYLCDGIYIYCSVKLYVGVLIRLLDKAG